MPEITSYEHGVPSWIDMGAPDQDAAVAFYGKLFGWDFDEGVAETGFYRQARIKGHPVAGIGRQQDPDMPPVWLTYLNVTNANDTATKVVEAGGTVLYEPTDVADLGRMAVFADTTDAVFAVWQPGTHRGAGLIHEPGTFTWAELITTDMTEARTFYRTVFGWASETHATGPFTYTEFHVGDRSIAGGMPKGPQMPPDMPSNWGIYFAVADLDATLASVKELGGEIVFDPMESPAGRFCLVADPQDGLFSVIQLVDQTLS